MAIEGFTAGQHNRSDEAFTIADLEEFEAANNVSSTAPSTTPSSTKHTKPTSTNPTSTNPTSTKTTSTKPTSTKPTSTNPTSTKHTKPTSTKHTKPTITNMTDELDEEAQMETDKEEDEASHFKDLDPDTEDPEMDDSAEAGMDTEEPARVMDEDAQDMEMATGKFTDLEGFTGSRVVSENWLNSLLKTILLVFVGYVLFHPSTSKVMAKNFGNTGLSRDLIICALFFIICYIILVSF